MTALHSRSAENSLVSSATYDTHHRSVREKKQPCFAPATTVIASKRANSHGRFCPRNGETPATAFRVPKEVCRISFCVAAHPLYVNVRNVLYP